jgi:integrase
MPRLRRELSFHNFITDFTTPVSPRLLVHRRWKERKLIANCFVEFNGKPVASVKKGFRTAIGLAKLPGRVTPHTLRHTAATWLMQLGAPIWEAAPHREFVQQQSVDIALT